MIEWESIIEGGTCVIFHLADQGVSDFVTVLPMPNCSTFKPFYLQT